MMRGRVHIASAQQLRPACKMAACSNVTTFIWSSAAMVMQGCRATTRSMILSAVTIRVAPP